MTVGAFALYGLAKEEIIAGTIALASDDFSAILVGSSYTPDLAADETYADVSAHEASGAGYTTGGIDIGSIGVSRVGAVVTLDSAVTLAWPASSITAKYLVLVRRAGVSLAPTDRLLGVLNLNTNGGSVHTAGGTLEVQWNPNGIYEFN
jgi:hypothetical protein